MPQPPAPPVFVAGFEPEQADFNNLIQTPLFFCTYKTVLRVTAPAGGQSVSASAYTVVQYTSVAEDPYSGWSTTATGSQPAYSYLAPYDGWYDVTVTAACGAVAGQHLEPTVLVSGSTSYDLGGAAAGSSTSPIVTASVKVGLIGGQDYVQGRIWAAVATTTSGAPPYRNCAMEIVFCGE